MSYRKCRLSLRERQPYGSWSGCVQGTYGRTISLTSHNDVFTCNRSANLLYKKPPLPHRGSRLATLVYQGRDPTQPYPTLVIRDRAPHFRTAFRHTTIQRRCSATRQDGRFVRSYSPDSFDLTSVTPSSAKSSGRISPKLRGPAPRLFRTRASFSCSGIASSGRAVGGS